jgi:hypothetical protein
MHARTDEVARVHTWRRRSAVVLGVAGVLLAMATFAMASTGGGGNSAISQKALDKILYGQTPPAQVVPAKLGAATAARRASSRPRPQAMRSPARPPMPS